MKAKNIYRQLFIFRLNGGHDSICRGTTAAAFGGEQFHHREGVFGGRGRQAKYGVAGGQFPSPESDEEAGGQGYSCQAGGQQEVTASAHIECFAVKFGIIGMPLATSYPKPSLC
jgi:hypothetical protein